MSADQGTGPAARLLRAASLAALACGLVAACAGGPEPGPGPGARATTPATTSPEVPASTVPGATAGPMPPAGPVPGTPPAPATATPFPGEVAQTPGPTPRPVCVEGAGCFGRPRHAGTFDAAAVPEASGLAASVRNPGILWLLDDRPGTRTVWAMRTTGQLLGPVAVEGLDARDTEALAIGPCGPDDATPCVYVGDIGDNRRARDAVTVHRFVEPDLSGGVPVEPVAADAVRLTYPPAVPGGRPEAHDAEALLVDADGALLVVTKAPFDTRSGETGQARLYVADRFAGGALVDHGTVPVPEPAAPLHSLAVGNVVTGGDARDGLVLLRTYDQVLLYVAPEPGAPLRSFPSWPAHEVPSALEPQSEAIAWAADGCGYFTVGERAGDLWFVPCLP